MFAYKQYVLIVTAIETEIVQALLVAVCINGRRHSLHKDNLHSVTVSQLVSKKKNQKTSKTIHWTYNSQCEEK